MRSLTFFHMKDRALSPTEPLANLNIARALYRVENYGFAVNRENQWQTLWRLFSNRAPWNFCCSSIGRPPSNCCRKSGIARADKRATASSLLERTLSSNARVSFPHIEIIATFFRAIVSPGSPADLQRTRQSRNAS